MIIRRGSFEVEVNGLHTGVTLTGSFNVAKKVIRVTPKQEEKVFKAVNIAKNKNYITDEHYQSGYYDIVIADHDNKYKLSYHCGGLSNNLDNGFFYRKIE